MKDSSNEKVYSISSLREEQKKLKEELDEVALAVKPLREKYEKLNRKITYYNDAMAHLQYLEDIENVL